MTLFKPRGQHVVSGVEGEGLGDVGAGSAELDGQLLHCIGVFAGSLGGPGPGHDVTPLFQGYNVASVANDNFSPVQSFKN